MATKNWDAGVRLRQTISEGKDADQVALNAEEANSAYSGRPDSRPWSERHPAVLWTAIVAAVLILGAVAVRSLKTASPST